MSGARFAVAVDGVHKAFDLPQEQIHTLKERLLHPLRRPGSRRLEALRDVSFTVERGEFFGIVGRNGSGKSTLLKCLAGIYAADRGGIYIDGRLSTFIELGVGFNPDLAARDNIMLNATMLGLSPREARRRVDAVVDFAELHDFVDLKLKNYSSGMMVRLAFAVMIQVDADVLLIDEVLAVGDAAFQQKCFDEFARIRRRGCTMLLVTHDMGAIQRFCDRGLLLEHGVVQEIGDPARIGNRYLELNFADERGAGEDQEPAAEAEDADDGGEAGEAEPEAGPQRWGDGSAEILEGWFEDEQGRRVTMLHSGAPCTFAARVHFRRDAQDPLFGINIHNMRGDNLLAASNLWTNPESGRFAAGETVVFRVRFTCVLAPDRYVVTPAVARAGQGLAWLDRRERMASAVVVGTRQTDALLDLDYDVDITRATEATAS